MPSGLLARLRVPRSPLTLLIPAEEARVELTVINSHFATAAPVFTVEEAKAFIARIKAEFADALLDALCGRV